MLNIMGSFDHQDYERFIFKFHSKTQFERTNVSIQVILNFFFFFFLIINKDFIKRKNPTLREIQPYIEGRKCDIRHSKIPYQERSNYI